jgi:prevent-host-death family protein
LSAARDTVCHRRDGLLRAMRLLRRYRDYMERVGVRELKASLSRYLVRVREGETIEVTDRGRPVARLVPVGIPEHIAKLMAEGKVTWSGTPFRPPRHRLMLTLGSSISDYINEDQG